MPTPLQVSGTSVVWTNSGAQFHEDSTAQMRLRILTELFHRKRIVFLDILQRMSAVLHFFLAKNFLSDALVNLCGTTLKNESKRGCLVVRQPLCAYFC